MPAGDGGTADEAEIAVIHESLNPVNERRREPRYPGPDRAVVRGVDTSGREFEAQGELLIDGRYGAAVEIDVHKGLSRSSWPSRSGVNLRRKNKPPQENEEMSRKSVRLSMLGIALGLLCLAGANSTSAQTVSVTTKTKDAVDFTGTTCDGYPVRFTGYQNNVWEVTTDDDGKLILNAHTNWQGVSGVDTLDRNYRGMSVNNDTFELSSLGTEMTVTTSHRWVGKGKGAPNMFFHRTYNVKVDSAGNVLVDALKEKENTECK